MGTLHWEVTGSDRNPPLVLVHGWGVHSGVWDDWLPLLETRFQVTRLDIPGFGRSSLLPDPYTLETLAEQLIPCTPDRAIWLGWSLGGAVAAQMATANPDRVQGLFTLAHSPCFVAHPGWPAGMDRHTFEAFRQAVERNPAKTLQRFLMLQVQGDPSPKVRIGQLKRVLAQHPQNITREALLPALDLLGRDYRALHAELSVPRLHLFGERDGLVPVVASAEWRDDQSDIEVIEGAAHVPFLSHPERVFDSLTRFANLCHATNTEVRACHE